MAEVKIGTTIVGDGHPSYIIAEIGASRSDATQVSNRID
jgi:hypothetical protein